jgi:hypothetical protein
MKINHFSEADCGSTSQEIHRILEYLVVHYRVDKTPLTGLCPGPEESSPHSHNLPL